MASKQEENSPLVVGTTSLPRQVLSYRWDILDAKIYLKQCDELKSPQFSTAKPVDISWFLKLTIDRRRNTFTMHLLKAEELNVRNKRNILISNCSVSIINSGKKKVIYTYTIQDTTFHSDKLECVIANSHARVTDSENFHNGMLTIQVEATLFDLTNPVGYLEERQPLPECNGIKSLLDDQLFTDLTIKCAEKEFKAHKAVLASQSPVFKRMLMTNMKEKNSGVIILTDIGPAVLSELLTYLYSRAVPNMHELATDLLVVADKYEISRLFVMCENHLKSTLEASTVVPLLVRAEMHNAAHLKKACLKYIHVNSAEVYKTNEWKQFKENTAANLSLLMEIMEYTL